VIPAFALWLWRSVPHAVLGFPTGLFPVGCEGRIHCKVAAQPAGSGVDGKEGGKRPPAGAGVCLGGRGWGALGHALPRVWAYVGGEGGGMPPSAPPLTWDGWPRRWRLRRGCGQKLGSGKGGGGGVCGGWGGRHLVLFMIARTNASPAPFSRPVLLLVDGDEPNFVHALGK